MNAADKWCAGYGRPAHVPDVPPVPVDGGPARLCSTCDRNRRTTNRKADQ